MLLILLFGLFSCKKDKLEGEKAILEGRWEVKYFIKKHKSLLTGGTSIVDTLYPMAIGHSFAFEFLKKGILCQVSDGELIRKDRVVFDAFNEELPNSEYDHLCVIRLNNKDDDFFVATLNEQNMSVGRNPISDQFVADTIGTNAISYNYIYTKK